MEEESKRSCDRTCGVATVNERGYLTFLPCVAILSFVVGVTIITGCAYNTQRLRNSLDVSPHPETPWSPPDQVIGKQAAFRTLIAEK